MKNNLVSVVIPVYNEEGAIKQTIEDIRKAFKNSGKKYEIVTVNDGSKDRSLEILQKTDGINVVNHPFNKGYGASLKTGIKEAKGDLIIITDADGTYQNELMPQMAGIAESYEMVVAARTTFKSKYPISKKIAKIILGFIIRLLTRTKIPDMNSGLRAFRKDTATKLFHLLPDKFSFTTTITISYISENRSIKYIDSEYYEREGDSKIVPFDFFRFVFKIISTVNYFMPLRIFSPIAFILGLGAIISLTVDIFLLKNLTDTTTLLAITSILIFLMGFLADLIVKRTTST